MVNDMDLAPAIAAIDIGTNSVHMVVARRLDGGAPEVLSREKEPVRLGRGSTDMKRLESAAIERTVEALDRFRRIAEAHDAEIVAVATSAVREAENQDEFLQRARVEAGVEVSVISGGNNILVIGSDIFPTPTFLDGQIYMRVGIRNGQTRSEALYCFGVR